MVSFHLAMFDCHYSSGSGHIKYSICHVAPLNPMIDGFGNLMSWSSLWYVTTLPD